MCVRGFDVVIFVFSSRRRHTRCALVTGVQTCALPISWSRGAQPGERVKSVSVNGKPLDPTATYTVATNDFIAAGGDGYAVLTETKPLIDGDAAKYMASMVMDYIAATGEVAPKIEGRLKAVD